MRARRSTGCTSTTRSRTRSRGGAGAATRWCTASSHDHPGPRSSAASASCSSAPPSSHSAVSSTPVCAHPPHFSFSPHITHGLCAHLNPCRPRVLHGASCGHHAHCGRLSSVHPGRVCDAADHAGVSRPQRHHVRRHPWCHALIPLPFCFLSFYPHASSFLWCVFLLPLCFFFLFAFAIGVTASFFFFFSSLTLLKELFQ